MTVSNNGSITGLS